MNQEDIKHLTSSLIHALQESTSSHSNVVFNLCDDATFALADIIDVGTAPRKDTRTEHLRACARTGKDTQLMLRPDQVGPFLVTLQVGLERYSCGIIRPEKFKLH